MQQLKLLSKQDHAGSRGNTGGVWGGQGQVRSRLGRGRGGERKQGGLELANHNLLELRHVGRGLGPTASPRPPPASQRGQSRHASGIGRSPERDDRRRPRSNPAPPLLFPVLCGEKKRRAAGPSLRVQCWLARGWRLYPHVAAAGASPPLRAGESARPGA